MGEPRSPGRGDAAPSAVMAERARTFERDDPREAAHRDESLWYFRGQIAPARGERRTMSAPNRTSPRRMRLLWAAAVAPVLSLLFSLPALADTAELCSNDGKKLGPQEKCPDVAPKNPWRR